ncbi:MAG: outer membrane lipoprotein-sorting protein [Spirochaetales bacterium]|nr:outer membrane lipoprotein-sorting protein [Spirochaetales bacterium]
MRKTQIVLILTVVFLVLGQAAFALTGDEILNKVEDTLSGPKDYEGTATMVLSNMDGSDKETRVMKIWMAGKEKRVIKFASPAGIRGIGMLAVKDDEMYLYLPAQNKIRRIEGGAKNGDFQGTDFSYDEMASYTYKNDYTARLASDKDGIYTLELIRKAGSTRVYDKLVMAVEAATFIPKSIELYKDGILTKKLFMDDTQKHGSYIIPVKIRMENYEKNHVTEMVIDETKFDQNLEDKSVFTKRFLKKRV